jgi:hypothetical protein
VSLAEKRLALVERDLEDLTRSRDQLRRLIETCATGSDTDCLELAPPER